MDVTLLEPGIPWIGFASHAESPCGRGQQLRVDCTPPHGDTGRETKSTVLLVNQRVDCCQGAATMYSSGLVTNLVHELQLKHLKVAAWGDINDE